MRELVVKYLNKQMSRRSFVGNLTKAGITMTAAQGVLASVSSVSVAQTGPPRTGRRRRRRAGRARDRRTGDHRASSARCRAPAAPPLPTSSSPRA